MANQTLILNVSNEMKLDNDREILCEESGVEKLCSSSLDTTEELYSSSELDACGDGLFVGARGEGKGRKWCMCRFLRKLGFRV